LDVGGVNFLGGLVVINGCGNGVVVSVFYYNFFTLWC